MLRLISSFAAPAACLAILLCPAARAQSGPGSPGEGFPLAAKSAAWTFFTDSRAVYHEGQAKKTYAGYIDAVGSIRAFSLDHATGATDSSLLHARLQVDDHDNPALHVRKDGRISAYYAKHGNESFLYRRTTRDPESIAAWGPEQTLPAGGKATYAHVFRLSEEGGRTHLFTRAIDWHPTWHVSHDDGDTWNAGRKLIGGPGARPYVKYVSDGKSRIHFAFTDGHPRDVADNGIHYARYAAGVFTKAGGARIEDTAGLPLEPRSEAEVVYDGKQGRAWIWDIALDSAGHPVLVYARAPQETDHRYHYARWDGTRWIHKELTAAGKWFPLTPAGTTEREPHYSGGIILDHADPSVVYLTRPVGGIFEIEEWRTADKGLTWTSRAITSKSAKNNVRPVLAWSSDPGKAPRKRTLFWMHGDYVHYTQYSTALRYFVFPDPATRLERTGTRVDRQAPYGWRHRMQELLGRWLVPAAR